MHTCTSILALYHLVHSYHIFQSFLYSYLTLSKFLLCIFQVKQTNSEFFFLDTVSSSAGFHFVLLDYNILGKSDRKDQRKGFIQTQVCFLKISFSSLFCRDFHFHKEKCFCRKDIYIGTEMKFARLGDRFFEPCTSPSRSASLFSSFSQLKLHFGYIENE